MTVHNIRLAASTVNPNGDPVDVQVKKTEAEDWADSHDEVLETERAAFRASNTAIDGSGTDYYYASFRFAWTEDPTQLKSEVSNWLTDNFEWWVVSYHECNHDGGADTRSGCEWDNEWSHGSPPSPLLKL